MGRLMILLGLLMIGGGIAGWFVNNNNVNLDGLTIDPTAADLCEVGETLDQDLGAEEYTPGQGWGRPVQYFCVDDAGERRQVTGDFVEGLFSGTGSFISGIFGSILWMGLVGLGFTVLVIGFFVNARPRFGSVYSSYASPMIYTTPTTFTSTPTSTPSTPGETKLTKRLRELDDARAQGLISSEEYNRLRQKALDES